MSELITDAEIPISNSTWSFDTLRVYLLRHILALQHTSDAGVLLVRELMAHNDQRYMVMFQNAELTQASLREVIHLKDDKYESQFKSLEETSRAQLAALKENTAIAFTASERAIEKAALAAEKRFESVNEFRKSLTDQTATFMPRPQIEALVQNVNDKIDAQRRDQSTYVTRIEVEQQFKSMTQQLTVMQAWQDRNDGRSTGVERTVDTTKVNWHLMLATVAVIISVVSALVTVILAMKPPSH
ncbi:MAG TPA: hypothetical protein VGP83_17045 [Pyrinomonadaceae bacterium]|jgi:hypothetical protein|nr:hypothetical protein [Pyrinomonadaceae bacterium]